MYWYQFGCGILKMVGPKKYPNSVDFWHQKLTLKVQFWHFLTNRNSSTDFFKENSFEYVDSWPKKLLLRTHHTWNSTTELTLVCIMCKMHSNWWKSEYDMLFLFKRSSACFLCIKHKKIFFLGCFADKVK